jgi:general stress protein 26
MDSKIISFLSDNRICVLSVVMVDGSSHSSVMHYSHSADPLVLYFSTDVKSRKCLPLHDHHSSQASVAIGFSETDWLTLQLSGTLRIITNDEKLNPETIASIKSIHYTKHPASAKYAEDPDTVVLQFVPSWWRYTDFSSHPPVVIENE